MSAELEVLIQALGIVKAARLATVNDPSRAGYEILRRITERFESEVKQHLGRP